MLNIRAALYLALLVGANAAPAQPADPAALAAAEALRAEDMLKLVFADPVPAAPTAFLDETGAEMVLADFAGRWVVLNFWATWCAPCRAEMATLSALQTMLGGEALQVVTIATGRNDPMEMKAFMQEIGVDNLPLYTDPRQALARDMGVMGLPVTVILDPEGQEVARLMGDADWASDSAAAVLTALVGAGG